MTKDEALKMAIEIMQRYLKETPLGNQPHMIAHKAEEAIQACKEALENLEKDPPISRNEQPAKEQLTDSQCDEFRRLPMSFNDMVRAIYKAGQKALEQPKNGIELEWYCKGWDDAEKDLATQEPVAWVYEWEDEKAVKLTFHPDSKAKVIPLYTHPAKSWQGLSDAEVDDVFNLGHHTFKEFARAIEQALKEKNNGS